MAVHVREMTRADLPGVIDVGTVAFGGDEISVWLHPGQFKYVTSFRGLVADTFKPLLHTPGVYGAVCVDDETGAILGYSWWKRTIPASQPQQKKTDPWMQNNQSWGSYFEATLFALEKRYKKASYQYPSTDFSRLSRLMAFETGFLTAIKETTTTWYLDALAVAPHAQRRGVGGALVDWGLARARQEGQETGVAVPVTLIASPSGLGLYKKKGFAVADSPSLATRESLAGDGIYARGGHSCVWDPDRVWVEDVPSGTTGPCGTPVEVVLRDKTHLKSAQ